MQSAQTITLSIFDLTGNCVFTTTQNLGTGMQQIPVNINGANYDQASSGIYIYRLVVGQSVYNGKVSIIK